jgi:hypothetical protein
MSGGENVFNGFSPATARSRSTHPVRFFGSIAVQFTAKATCRAAPLYALFFPRPLPALHRAPSPSDMSLPGCRLSFRAITVVFVFSRAAAFRVRTSSFVHGRSFVIAFFTISVLQFGCAASKMPTDAEKDCAKISSWTAPTADGLRRESLADPTGAPARYVQRRPRLERLTLRPSGRVAGGRRDEPAGHGWGIPSATGVGAWRAVRAGADVTAPILGVQCFFARKALGWYVSGLGRAAEVPRERAF